MNVYEIDRLIRAVHLGNLLHGSPHRVSLLEPQPAFDTVRQAGRHVGIYATLVPRVAVAAALIHPLGPHWHSGWEGDEHHLRLYGSNIALGPGFVYIVRAAPFKQLVEDDGTLSSDYLSREPVEPVGVVRVTPEVTRFLNITVQIA